MARRREHTPEEIKQMVIKAAETIVTEDGSAKLNVRNIASEIGYTVGSIYMVFNNLADLILHIKARTLDDLLLCLLQVPADNPDQEYLLALSKAYLSFATQHFNRWQMLFEPQQSAMVIPDWYKLKVMQLSTPATLHFQRLAPQVSTEQAQRAAQALLGSVQGICFLSLAVPPDKAGIGEAEAILALLVESFSRGWMNSNP